MFVYWTCNSQIDEKGAFTWSQQFSWRPLKDKVIFLAVWEESESLGFEFYKPKFCEISRLKDTSAHPKNPPILAAFDTCIKDIFFAKCLMQAVL